MERLRLHTIEQNSPWSLCKNLPNLRLRLSQRSYARINPEHRQRIKITLLRRETFDNEARVIVYESLLYTIPYYSYWSFQISTRWLTSYRMSLHSLTIRSISPHRHMGEHALRNRDPHPLRQRILQSRILITFAFIITTGGGSMIQNIIKSLRLGLYELNEPYTTDDLYP